MDSAFFKGCASPTIGAWLDPDVLRDLDRESEEAIANTWAYIGRFMWGFAIVENLVDSNLLKLFNFNHVAWLVLVGNLDLRKKLKFLEVGFKHMGVDDNDNKVICKTLHKLHDVRNLLAHNRFRPHYRELGDGLEFEYVDSSGKTEHQKFKTSSEEAVNFMPYSQLDSYDEEMFEMDKKLSEILDSLRPITEASADLARDIAMITEGSENVIRFPTVSTPKKDT